MTFVLDAVENEESMWRCKNFEQYIMKQFPEVAELSSSRIKLLIKRLAVL